MIPGGLHNFAFSVFTFDAECAELRRNGGRLRIPEQSSRVLTLLLENAGTVVTREELKQYLWQDGEFLDHDHSISNAVSQLRAVLHDHSRPPKFIETIPKRGYRFVAEVSLLPETPGPKQDTTVQSPMAVTGEAKESLPPESLPSNSADAPDQIEADSVVPTEPQAPWIKRMGLRWAIVCGLSLVLLAAVGFAVRYNNSRKAPHPAVLALGIAPFEVTGKGAEEFAESFRMDLTDAMSKLPGVQVRAAHSFSKAEQDESGIRKTASTLHLDALVFGKFALDKQAFVLELEIVNGQDASHLASFRYTGTKEELAAIRDRAQRDIFSSFQPSMGAQRKNPGDTNNPRAYESYLRARYHLSQWTDGALDTAFDEFNEAIAADPNFAKAYAGMASAYVVKGEHSLGPRAESYGKAREMAAKAVHLDASLAEAHAILGYVAFRQDWNFALAETELRQAVQLEPGQTMNHLWLAAVLGSTGRFEEALQQIDLAHAADPLWPPVYLTENYLATSARQYDRAAEASHKLLVLMPEWSLARDQQAWLLWYTGRYTEAINDWREMASEEKDSARLALENRGLEAFRRGGVPAYARIKVEAIKSGRKWAHPNDFGDAEWYLNAGDRDKAIVALEAMVDRHDPECIQLAVGPAYTALHQDPRFIRLLDRVGLSLPRAYPKATQTLRQ